MNFEKFNKNKNQKRIIIGSIIGIFAIVGIITLYRTFAFYETQNDFNILQGKIGEFSLDDIQLAFTIDGEKKDESFPEKNSGYYGSNVTCTNGVTADWDNNLWSLTNIKSNNQKRINCNIDFTTSIASAENFIMDLARTDTTNLAVDNYVRYIGANPNNYVVFNNELWRIISVVTGHARAEEDKSESKSCTDPSDCYNSSTRVKIIRAESIGNYGWNNKETDKYWPSASLREYLNGTYYDSLTDEAKNMIDTVGWPLGGPEDTYTASLTAKQFYNAEIRNVKDEWMETGISVGKIGLMYVSDYGYATGGGSLGRNTCLNNSIEQWSKYSDCYNDNWLFDSTDQWTLTQVLNNSDNIWHVTDKGSISKIVSGWDMSVRPVVYLKVHTAIIGGNGTIENPYVLSR